MMIYDKTTGFPLSDPDARPFSANLEGSHASAGESLEKELREKAFSAFILSAAGWRKVFASGGDEESTSAEIALYDKEIVAAMAYVLGSFLKNKAQKLKPTILAGTDSRYSGPSIADVMLRVFIAMGFNVRFLFITAAPEIMAYVRMPEKKFPKPDGFVYITASHNPIGHNGIKFGLNDGGVIGGEDSEILIRELKETVGSPWKLKEIRTLADSADPAILRSIYSEIDTWKLAARKAYANFTKEVVTALSDAKKQKAVFLSLRTKAAAAGIGIIAELNGSARTLSIDKAFLNALNVKVRLINGKPREIVHRIVPEGGSLDLCREELEKSHREDPSFILGYVPDNDGDRGNIVYLGNSSGRARSLEAQEVFALSVLAEFSYLVYMGLLTYSKQDRLEQKAAVVVNGPTSMRVDRIAESFGVSVFRSEVGEANVVNLARQLRSEGYLVRILGEGSNGGNITHPAAVRDPLNTICAFLKLLLLTSDARKPGLFELWCRKSGRLELYTPDFTLQSVIATLPRFVTTSVYEPRAMMKISTTEPALLKTKYEEIFLREWERKRSFLWERLKISGWREENYEGLKTKTGLGHSFQSGRQKGGLKILFYDKDGRDKAFIWMRASGTEPILRILADVEGDDLEAEAWLLDWHREMIKQADT
ncbi:MAG: phosphatidylglycerol lysyltransferase [Spirochaetota bacterium]